MNILEFSDYGAPYAGNFIASLKNLKKSYNGGNIVFLFTEVSKDKAFVKDLGQVYFLTGSMLKNFFILRKIIKEEKIDIIHSHFLVLKYDIPLKLARIFSRKTTYLRHMHIRYHNKRWKVFEAIKRLIANGDVEIACGQAVYDNMRELGFKRLELVPNGVDFSRLDEFKSVQKSGTDVLLFGYNYLVKGVDIAIRAAFGLPNVRLNIVAAAKKDELIKAIQADFGKVPEFVKILDPIEDVATYFRGADLFLAPSRQEGAPYAIAEAVYCETTVVASNIPSHSDLPKEFLFESEDHNDLREKMKYAFDHPLSTEIKNKIMKRFSLDEWSAKMIFIFEK